MTNALRMPGGTLLTRLRVYDTVAPDGQISGTPHFHFLCTEMYFVLSGSGGVEMIDANGFSRVELFPHSALVFSPGTLHRLINPNGDLELLVVMQNSGLPERGDNVVCFTDEWMCDDDRFAEAMRVVTVEDAYRRRDRGVEGFLQIKAAFEKNLDAGQSALNHFYKLAAERTASRRAEWESIIQNGALVEVNTSIQNAQSLNKQDVSFLMDAQHHLIHVEDDSRLGFCGHLNRYFDPATLTMEGISER